MFDTIRARMAITPQRTVAAGAVVSVALLTVIGVSTTWFISANSLRDNIEAWAEARRAEGYVVEYQGVEVSGFPFRLTTVLAAPAIAEPNHPNAWAWKGDRVVFEGSPWDFTELQITLPAAQEFRYRPVAGGDRVVTATVDQGVAQIALQRGVIEGFTLAVSGLTLSTADDALRVERLAAEGRRVARDTRELSLAIDDLTLPARMNGPMGREIARFAAEATVKGPLTPGDLPAVLIAWSEAGGTVELKAVDLRWRDLDITASGTLALDREMRPQAALSAEIVGYGAALVALAEGGAMKARDAVLTATALDLLARPRADGVRVLTLPLTAQDGTLFVGPLALLRLSPVVRR